MNKKKIVLSAIIASTFVGLPKTEAVAVAEDATSEATITAIPGTEPVNPVDPKKPDQPSDGGDGVSPNQSGPLQINWVPNLRFGDDIKITQTKVTEQAKNDDIPYVQISDLRGTGAGWSLNASLGDFVSVTGKKITGAKITFTDGEVVTSNLTMENPAKAQDIVLDAGSNTVSSIMKATQGNGRGTWLTRFEKEEGATDNKKITFEAPSDKIDTNTKYTAVITWQLADTPNI